MSVQSQYAAAANIPLVKSPSLRVPKPVELPQDIHPLPETVTPYFAYPFTLEPHVITLESSRRTTVASHVAGREAYIRSRAEVIEKRKRDALHKVAPGLGTMLVPTRASPVHDNASPTVASSNQPMGPVDVMDALVDQLAALESKKAG